MADRYRNGGLGYKDSVSLWIRFRYGTLYAQTRSTYPLSLLLQLVLVYFGRDHVDLKVKISMGKLILATSDYHSTNLRRNLHLPEVEHVRPVSISPQYDVASYYQMTNRMQSLSLPRTTKALDRSENKPSMSENEPTSCISKSEDSLTIV